MDIDMNAMKAEIGGAFAVAWLVIGIGMEWDLTAAVLMAAVWMAFSGAHVLPVITWMHIMTGDLGDTEGNWMPNGMRLIAQVVGAGLAIALLSEMGALDSLGRLYNLDSRLLMLGAQLQWLPQVQFSGPFTPELSRLG